jgi:Leucine-rich repeat (LRR) protein
MRKRLILLLLFWMVRIIVSAPLHAQYITIPDANFASFLVSNYPSAMNGSNQLDTNVAKTFTGNFIAISKNITNVSGIEYFINISQLSLSGNKIMSLPTSFNRLTKITKLELDTNKLTTLPDLHSMTMLQYLYCQYNNITNFPSMVNMTSVIRFFCHKNQLTSLPDITGMTSLNHFICSDNFITTLPDMSTLTSLDRFLCSNNKFTSVNITSIPNVTQVHFKNNKLVDFPVITGMTQLKELQLDGNTIQSLPDMSPFVNLTILAINNNRLTFEDLLPLAALPGFSGFVITPQKNIGTADTLLLKEKGSFNYSTGVDLLVNSNHYTWFKNGLQISAGSVPFFKVSPLQFSDAGVYTFQIKNSTPLFTSITLQSNPITLKIISCMDLSQLRYTQVQESCHSPIYINIEEASIYNAIRPVSYTLKNILNNTLINSSAASIPCFHYGLYELTITDSLNCQLTYSAKIEINKKPECDLVIYPDMETTASVYYLNQNGKAIVYSSAGQKVKELTLPAYWDGKNQQGKIVDSGYYIIIVNEQMNIPISVMRTQ